MQECRIVNLVYCSGWEEACVVEDRDEEDDEGGSAVGKILAGEWVKQGLGGMDLLV